MERQIIELVERCQTGERKAMEQLVAQIQNDIYYHCKKMLRSEEDAKDATQEILITILTKLPELKTPAAFHGWMSTITYNRCVNMVTRRKREEQIPDDDDGKDLLETYETMDEQVLPDKALDTAEMRRMIAELVDELPELQRMTVLFYYFDELSVKDIAQAMGTSEGTVKSRLNYARKAIKEGVEKYEKQGIKLYGISPLPFLLYFLRTDAKASGLNRADAAAMLQSVVNGTVEGTAAGVVSGGAASATAGAEAASASMASGVAAGAAKIGFSLGTKVLAGVIAAATAIGGLTVGIASQINDRPLPEPTMSDLLTTVMNGGDSMFGEESSPVSADVSVPPDASKVGELVGNPNGELSWENLPALDVPEHGNASHGFEQKGNCENNSVLTLVYNEKGDSVSVGVKKGQGADILYLNPTASTATEARPVGFYITSSRCPIVFPDGIKWDSMYSDGMKGVKNAVIRQAYDELKPAEYLDETSFGVGWRNDVLFDGREGVGADLYFRAIDLSKAKLLVTFKVTVVYNASTDTFSLEGIENCDVRHTGQMSEEDRTILLNRAFDLAIHPDYGPNDPPLLEEHRELAVNGGIVQRVDELYFNRCLNEFRHTTLSYRFTSGFDLVFAVSMPVPGGFLTMYYSPDADPLTLELDQDAPPAPIDISPITSMDLRYFAQDLFCPYSRTMPNPGNYFDPIP